jgi:hypothetical protein
LRGYEECVKQGKVFSANRAEDVGRRGRGRKEKKRERRR